jgi:excisionase family DNA binding protein
VADSTPFLILEEAAELLRVQPDTLYAWVEQKPPRVPFRRAGRRLLFDRDELIEWTRQQAGS